VEQIQVANIGGTSFRATGCGQEATYNCVAGNGQILCVREEQKAVTTQVTSATPK